MDRRDLLKGAAGPTLLAAMAGLQAQEAADGFRDDRGRIKRQAIRFRIYAYSRTAWPTGESTEVKLGSMLDGKRVADGKLMPIRRPQDGPLDSPDRFRRRFVDPGPRALSAQARRRASRTMARYPSSRAAFYAAEAQWPDAPFWRRRQFRDTAVA